jgi:hypothetical protein
MAVHSITFSGNGKVKREHKTEALAEGCPSWKKMK